MEFKSCGSLAKLVTQFDDNKNAESVSMLILNFVKLCDLKFKKLNYLKCSITWLENKSLIEIEVHFN